MTLVLLSNQCLCYSAANVANDLNTTGPNPLNSVQKSLLRRRSHVDLNLLICHAIVDVADNVGPKSLTLWMLDEWRSMRSGQLTEIEAE